MSKCLSIKSFWWILLGVGMSFVVGWFYWTTQPYQFEFDYFDGKERITLECPIDTDDKLILDSEEELKIPVDFLVSLNKKQFLLSFLDFGQGPFFVLNTTFFVNTSLEGDRIIFDLSKTEFVGALLDGVRYESSLYQKTNEEGRFIYLLDIYVENELQMTISFLLSIKTLNDRVCLSTELGPVERHTKNSYFYFLSDFIGSINCDRTY